MIKDPVKTKNDLVHISLLLVPGHLKLLEVILSVLTLCDPVDYSLPGSSVHGISQTRILEWVAISSSRGSSQPRDQTCISHTVGGFFTTEPSGRPTAAFSVE